MLILRNLLQPADAIVDKLDFLFIQHTLSQNELQIRGGVVQLRGSLRGSTFNQVLRVAVITGKRRGLGLLDPIHDIVSWEPV